MNPHLVSRLARYSRTGEPLSLTEREIAADELLSLENRERYVEQSASTRCGSAAPLPPRRPALRLVPKG